MGSETSDLHADQRPPATILVVDDEPIIRSLLNRFLSKSGYTVLESADGRDALEQLRQPR
jgi:CheY-like chemotaxis protein